MSKTITFDLELLELNEAIEKAIRLKELLEEVHDLLEKLKPNSNDAVVITNYRK